MGSQCEVKAFKLQQEKNDELEKMKSTSNILKKAMHYRNAALAYEKKVEISQGSTKQIPSKEDSVSVGNSLALSKFGTIWTVSRGLLGDQREFLGTAIASPGSVIEYKDLLKP